jgi:BASS family bile acid:Na+ symporter
MMAVLPLAAGMACRALWPILAARFVRPVALVAKVLLVLAVLGILAGVVPMVLTLVGDGAIIAMAGFVAAGLAIGHSLGGPAADDRTVLALSTASRHPAIALAIGKANFPDEADLGAAVVLFLLVNLIVAAPYQARRSGVAAKRMPRVP